MPIALGKECINCSSILNGIVFGFQDGYIGYNCCVSLGTKHTGSFKKPFRIDTALLTEEQLTDYQLLSALQSSTNLKPPIFEPVERDRSPYFTLFKPKYKKL